MLVVNVKSLLLFLLEFFGHLVVVVEWLALLKAVRVHLIVGVIRAEDETKHNQLVRKI